LVAARLGVAVGIGVFVGRGVFVLVATGVFVKAGVDVASGALLSEHEINVSAIKTEINRVVIFFISIFPLLFKELPYNTYSEIFFK
jgi:hypothetical protein